MEIKPIRLLPVFFGLFVAFISIATIWPTWQENQKMSATIQLLQKEVQTLRAKKQQCEKILQALEKDPNYVEFLLREQLYYGRKGEQILEERATHARESKAN